LNVYRFRTSNLPFRQRTTILCTNSLTVSECTSFCERQLQTTYKAHDTEAYGMTQCHINELDGPAPTESNHTNRVGKSVRLPTTRQDSQRSVQRLRPSVAFQTSDYGLPSLAVITSMSTTTRFHISPRDQTRMLYPPFNDKCSTTYL